MAQMHRKMHLAIGFLVQLLRFAIRLLGFWRKRLRRHLNDLGFDRDHVIGRDPLVIGDCAGQNGIHRFARLLLADPVTP